MTCPDTQRYLQIFNPAPETCTDFHQFARFPPEIRCLIWEQALSHERWIRIFLTSHNNDNTGRLMNFGRYYLCIYSRRNMSKLFRTTHESRRVALGFYRVQIPCFTRDWDREENKTTLYICPELDTLEVAGLKFFELFAYDVWARDRLRVGLVNLATRGVNTRFYTDWALDGRDKALLKQALLRIERFTVLNRDSKQKWLGDNLRDPTPLPSDPVHRACPLFGNTIGFERLPYDPRLCEEHLKQIFTGPRDPRMQFHAWFRVLGLLGIKHDHKVDYRYGMCHQNHSRGAQFGQDRNAAAEWVRKDEERFQSSLKTFCEVDGRYYSSPESQGLEEVPQQAIGFWLFPLKSLEPLVDPGIWFRNYAGRRTRGHFYFKRVLDMTKHKPELCLSIMH
ncbi:hypothetical protein FPOA_07860 [Fusarium poae]|uniref:2EXR domain-containing protein n=1 Tax=Fusarium poae TaxID=36050 RepID=A0A1B8ALV1_FUSPO|nr:hypothetical protein FPOA_07860 [Fusarium poae]